MVPPKFVGAARLISFADVKVIESVDVNDVSPAATTLTFPVAVAFISDCVSIFNSSEVRIISSEEEISRFPFALDILKLTFRCSHHYWLWQLLLQQW